ncbi:hypothetical protein HDU82_007122 [Entophlyctis luteolus]|nr:hypothetical protein HDU82_007122 [Entophlyctis luteolus]
MCRRVSPPPSDSKGPIFVLDGSVPVLPVEIIATILSFVHPITVWKLRLVSKCFDYCITRRHFLERNLRRFIPAELTCRVESFEPTEWDELMIRAPEKIQSVFCNIMFSETERVLWSLPLEASSWRPLPSASFATIPRFMGTMRSLAQLEMEGCGLSGPIPDEIFSLTMLISLSFANNQLHGAISPQIGKLVNLKALNFECNVLSGAIPAELGSCTNLEELTLSSNKLSGTIPAELGNLTNLTYLSLADNNLVGGIPSTIGQCGNLFYLNLSSNNLTGLIPPALGLCENLEFLYLSKNGLSGSVPTEIGRCVKLDIENNYLLGPITPGILDSKDKFSKFGSCRHQLQLIHNKIHQ